MGRHPGVNSTPLIGNASHTRQAGVGLCWAAGRRASPVAGYCDDRRLWPRPKLPCVAMQCRVVCLTYLGCFGGLILRTCVWTGTWGLGT